MGFGVDISAGVVICSWIEWNELREFIGLKGMMLSENEIREVTDGIGSNPATLKG